MNRSSIARPTRCRAKADLTNKICATCSRPFAWRKKWERDWNSVRHCSDRCRRGRAHSVKETS
ncbi:MAG: DUF2256 domain-containing protein [Rhizobiales bacterium]|nr:DUF2256 domain-containing protein [Hyphomicrobiales bacterium]